MTRVAWIGLGAMGARMAGRLLDAGHDLSVWNRTPSRADDLSAAGARRATSPSDAVRGAEIVVVMVTGPAAVDDVTVAPDGIAVGVGPDTTVVDMSTVGPAAARQLRALLPADVAVLDAPVLGSVAEAESGNLRLLIGGPADAVARATPLLSVLGEPVHLGPTGTGAAAKLVANAALFGVLGALGETLALADGLGIPREDTWRVLELTPLAAQAERRRSSIESAQYPPRFELALARKDADLIAAAASAAGVDLRVADAVRSWFADAENAGLGSQDYTAILSRILASGPRAPTPRRA